MYKKMGRAPKITMKLRVTLKHHFNKKSGYWKNEEKPLLIQRLKEIDPDINHVYSITCLRVVVIIYEIPNLINAN